MSMPAAAQGPTFLKLLSERPAKLISIRSERLQREQTIRFTSERFNVTKVTSSTY